MSCAYCFTDYISCGVEEITIFAGESYVPIGIYTPGSMPDYDLIVTHPNGATYKVTGKVNAFGDFTLPVASFPAGMFNPYAGMFQFHVTPVDCEDFLFCDYYKYIQFEVKNGNEEKNLLSCCPPDSGNTPTMTCCTTTTIPFANETSTTVNYTGTRPTIEVAYLNPDGVSYTLGSMGISTLVTFTGSSFTIDHGGLASGLIKLLK